MRSQGRDSKTHRHTRWLNVTHTVTCFSNASREGPPRARGGALACPGRAWSQLQPCSCLPRKVTQTPRTAHLLEQNITHTRMYSMHLLCTCHVCSAKALLLHSKRAPPCCAC